MLRNYKDLRDTRVVTVCAISAVATFLLFLPARSATAQNLLINGSFELPASNGSNEVIPGNSTFITGWTTTRNGVERFNPALFASGTAQDGSLVIDICPFTFTGGGIQQTFATTPNQLYRLTFFAGTSNASSRTGDCVIDVLVGNVTQSFTLLNQQAAIIWNPFTIDFTATDALTTLTFDNTQNANSHFANLDNVSVTSLSAAAAPEPGTLSLLLLLALPAACRRLRSH